MTTQTTDFEAWWEKEGRFIDPDTDDVPWFDKRKALARHAFEAGMVEGNCGECGA